jgi:hypothetical protein
MTFRHGRWLRGVEVVKIPPRWAMPMRRRTDYLRRAILAYLQPYQL